MIKIKKYKQNEPVYDITVKNTENFFANNILVHNCQEITQPVVSPKSLSVILESKPIFFKPIFISA